MHKKMAEAVARVARRVNETVENKEDHLDLADCQLNAFPIGLYTVMKDVTEAIFSISLANNEIKSLPNQFFATFRQLRELNLAGNCLHQLPEEVGKLQHLKVINLSRNKFEVFPQQLAAVNTLETINLEENQISDIPVDKLTSMKALQSVNLKSNPLNSERLAAYRPLIKFQLLTSVEEVPAAAQT
ncbi:leucine-rich repeat-containing protein 20 [Microcaecilia unicolor]|uniref:Leucine-rich repeat-containing protein 20 n=1 Tax=Microcaecilia unicolor TaxID=1415580 RepID=A0A6P7Y8E6_9AMPH|nr:leucine-rich repeat-containing protein 20 [Microcaecilia unicolor]